MPAYQPPRGSRQTLDRLARKLGLLMGTGRFLPPAPKHVLLFGHVGAGKTSELKLYATEMKKARCFLPVEVDVPGVLDRNNLQDADLLMAMANALLASLQKENIALSRGAVARLEKTCGGRR
jgi:Holliday junction resolvasome RuvABC ATP-dependent DNA helicase subunit